MKAVVHNQKYNSPLGLYSPQNVAETLATQTKVLTNGAPVSVVFPNMSGVPGSKNTDLYQNDEDEGYSRSPLVSSPTNMNRRQPQAPAPPPKPAATNAGGNWKPGPGSWTSGPQVIQQAQPQPQQVYKPQQQQQQPASNYYQPQRQQQQQQPRQQQQHHPQYPGSPPVQQSSQHPQYMTEQERYQLEQARLQQRPQYQPQFMPASNYNNVAPKSSSTFQSIIPVQSHSGGPAGGQPNWSPTTGRKPMWPPQKSQEGLLTSSQSIKFEGGTPGKKFIWPPPKGHVQVQEETDETGQIRTVYREVPDAQKARTYVSPRAPVRLGSDAWEPYSGRSYETSYNLGSGPGRRLRRFNDIFTPNSTRLPPTYRAPPGTQHVEYE